MLCHSVQLVRCGCCVQLGAIQNEFRTFEMEVIAGEPVFDVTVRECGAEFQLNFKEVTTV